MKYSDHRETIFKGLAKMLNEKRAASKPGQIPPPVATPRYLKDPVALAFTPNPNRASRRANLRRHGRHKLPAFTKPWGADVDA